MSSTGNAIDFVSIMLAKPTCLVALALYNNDFPKANQILEVSFNHYILWFRSRRLLLCCSVDVNDGDHL